MGRRAGLQLQLALTPIQPGGEPWGGVEAARGRCRAARRTTVLVLGELTKKGGVKADTTGLSSCPVRMPEEPDPIRRVLLVKSDGMPSELL